MSARTRFPVAVLVSGDGSNLQAILDASAEPGFSVRVVTVISDRPGVRALQRAEAAGVPTLVVEHRRYFDRAAFTDAVCDAAEAAGAEALVLAGFMRVLARSAIERFPNRILNVHPALLPAFPGARAVPRTLEHAVKVTGVTVHFVDEAVDHGPIIAQEAVSVFPSDDEADLHARLQEIEHRLFPEAVDALGRGALHVEGRRVTWAGR
jgi:formyltetrahydrofolate-dependent phosphoribosylglycinamide formyltransferase